MSERPVEPPVERGPGRAKREILARIRAARPDVVGQADVAPIPRDYHRTREIAEGLAERFRERVADYRAQVGLVRSDDVPVAVGAALADLGARRVAVATGLPEPWRRPSGAQVEVVSEDPSAPLDVEALQALDAVVTGCAVAIAETGTVILDGGPQCGRRALTLVPDAHVCLVRAEDIVDDVPAAVARLDPGRPLTWVSGPSATSDIELDRVEGVHGPRRLHVLVVTG